MRGRFAKDRNNRAIQRTMDTELPEIANDLRLQFCCFAPAFGERRLEFLKLFLLRGELVDRLLRSVFQFAMIGLGIPVRGWFK